MSQTVVHEAVLPENTTHTQLLDAIDAVARRLQWTVEGHGTHRMYDGRVTGFAVKPPRWNYPITCDDHGKFHYDTYEGRWGDQRDFDALEAGVTGKLAQDHAAGNLITAAADAGHRIASDTLLPDGSRRLEIQVGAGSALDAGSGGLGGDLGGDLL